MESGDMGNVSQILRAIVPLAYYSPYQKFGYAFDIRKRSKVWVAFS